MRYFLLDVLVRRRQMNIESLSEKTDSNRECFLMSKRLFEARAEAQINPIGAKACAEAQINPIGVPNINLEGTSRKSYATGIRIALVPVPNSNPNLHGNEKVKDRRTAPNGVLTIIFKARD
ncbi:hypothetical protein HAX54_012782 [Datura stramonium]|uniref:Uncharacterized protein n=1 Tax=Datura stramonium TaxID=4076 RepID=A0ABS8TN24_DATST|nr:hypothetical protein [Datura stramonium]